MPTVLGVKGSLVELLSRYSVSVALVIELCFLSGREKLAGYDVRSLIRVE